MSTVYYLSPTDFLIGNLAYDYEKSLATTQGGTNTTLGVSVPVSQSGVIHYVFTSTSGPGTLNWSSTFSGAIDVTVASSTVTYSVSEWRLAALAGGGDWISRGSQTVLPITTSGTGIKTFTTPLFTGVNDDPARATTDVLGLTARTSNSSSMTVGSFTMRVDNTDAQITAPWDVATATARSRNIRTSNPALPRSYRW